MIASEIYLRQVEQKGEKHVMGANTLLRTYGRKDEYDSVGNLIWVLCRRLQYRGAVHEWREQKYN